MASQFKEVKKLIKELAKEGWTLDMSGKHGKIRHPKYGFISISKSPSDGMAHKQILRDIRRRKNGTY